MLQQVKTAGGIHIEYEEHTLAYENAIEPLLERLDTHRGALFASSFEYPGRYTCWDIGFYNPPLAVICKTDEIYLEALNKRGEILLAMILPLLQASKELIISEQSLQCCKLEVQASQQIFSEEERSHQPSIFTVLRQLIAFLNQMNLI